MIQNRQYGQDLDFFQGYARRKFTLTKKTLAGPCLENLFVLPASRNLLSCILQI